MKIALILFFKLCIVIIITALNIDESVLDKDLYGILGVSKGASLQEIKKKYRKLAQKYHPDKASSSDKEKHAEIFRQIAEANEILSNDALRLEYDTYVNRGDKRQSNRFDNSGYNSQYSNSFDFSSIFDSFMDNYNDNFFDFGDTYARPVIVGPYLDSSDYLFPFSPIVLSSDKSHFFYLDSHCSLNVYFGDVDLVLRQLMSYSIPDTSNLPIEIKFKTVGDSKLKGMCYSVLSDKGILHVYSGQPHNRQHYRKTLWRSENIKDTNYHEDYYSSMYKRYFLELTDQGELMIQMFEVGKVDNTLLITCMFYYLYFYRLNLNAFGQRLHVINTYQYSTVSKVK